MPSSEGHVHWSAHATSAEVGFAEQALEIYSGNGADPQGSMRVRAVGEPGEGLHIPTEGWESVPGTSPTLEARADAIDPIGYLRLRIA